MSLCGLKNMGSVLRVQTSRWVFECGIGGFACQRVFAIQSQFTGFFLLYHVRERVQRAIFLSDELTPLSTCMDPGFFSGVEFCGGEFTRCIFLNEPLLIVAISPVRSAACASTLIKIIFKFLNLEY